MFKGKRAVFLFALCMLTFSLEAQVIRYLNKEWVVYDKSSHQVYNFPHEKKLPVHLLLDYKSNKGQILEIPTGENVSVYVNSAFFSEINAHKRLLIDIDSLASLTKGESAIISVYGNYNQRLMDSTCILPSTHKRNVSFFSKERATKLYLPKNLGKSYFAMFLLIGIIFFILVYNTYPKTFGQYFNLTDLFLNYKVDNLYMRSTFEGHYIASLLLSCFIFALAGVGLPVFSKDIVARDLWDFVRDLFYFLLFAVFFYFLKLIVTQVSAWFFSLEKYATLHFKIFVKISVVWSVLLSLLAILYYSGFIYGLSLTTFFALISLFFLTLISLKISVLINRVARVSTLYLISYLCITEWLPYFVILKLYENYFS